MPDAIERRKPKNPIVVENPPVEGVVSCYAQSAPSASCTLPTRCCFSSESLHHDGACSTSSCSWGTIDCDGPEDCASGQYCCATYTAGGVRLACQTGSCAAPPYGDELCHEPSICRDGRWCITAFGTQPALPRTLAVCR
ncbi:MAG TPA: hypothetical protein VIV11_16390 [Kofleriaceae bacterium]